MFQREQKVNATCVMSHQSFQGFGGGRMLQTWEMREASCATGRNFRELREGKTEAISDVSAKNRSSAGNLQVLGRGKQANVCFLSLEILLFAIS